MHLATKPGMTFFGVQGTPDEEVLVLTQRERSILEKARAIAEQARELIGPESDWGYEFARVEHGASFMLDETSTR